MRRFLLWILILESLAAFAASLYLLYHFQFMLQHARENRLALPEITIWMIQIGYPLNALIPILALGMPWAAWWPGGTGKVSHVLYWPALLGAGLVMWIAYLSVALPMSKIT